MLLTRNGRNRGYFSGIPIAKRMNMEKRRLAGMFRGSLVPILQAPNFWIPHFTDIPHSSQQDFLIWGDVDIDIAMVSWSLYLTRTFK